MDQGSLNVYRGCEPVVDAEFDSKRDGTPAEVLVEALAEAANVDPIELPPLYDYVDPDALNALFAEHKGASDADALLSFRVESWNVFIRADGRIRICDNTRVTDPELVFESTPA